MCRLQRGPNHSTRSRVPSHFLLLLLKGEKKRFLHKDLIIFIFIQTNRLIWWQTRIFVALCAQVLQDAMSSKLTDPVALLVFNCSKVYYYVRWSLLPIANVGIKEGFNLLLCFLILTARSEFYFYHQLVSYKRRNIDHWLNEKTVSVPSKRNVIF